MNADSEPQGHGGEESSSHRMTRMKPRMNPARQSRIQSPDQIGLHRRDAKVRRDHRPDTSAELGVSAVDGCATKFPRPEKTLRDSSTEDADVGHKRTQRITKNETADERRWTQMGRFKRFNESPFLALRSQISNLPSSAAWSPFSEVRPLATSPKTSAS